MVDESPPDRVEQMLDGGRWNNVPPSVLVTGTPSGVFHPLQLQIMIVEGKYQQDMSNQVERYPGTVCHVHVGE